MKDAMLQRVSCQPKTRWRTIPGQCHRAKSRSAGENDWRPGNCMEIACRYWTNPGV